MLTRIALVGPIILAGIWYLDGRLDRRRNLFDFVGLPAILAWVAYRQIQREGKKWNSVVLEFRGESLIRTLPDFPLLEITRSEVTTIVESAGGICIRTNSRRKALVVSTDLLDYSDFRNRLAAWAPVANLVPPSPSSRSSIMGIVSALCCMLLLGGPLYLVYTPHHELILPLGIVLFIGMAAMIWYYHDSPDMPTSFRKTSWILLLLPLLATISRLMESR